MSSLPVAVSRSDAAYHAENQIAVRKSLLSKDLRRCLNPLGDETRTTKSCIRRKGNAWERTSRLFGAGLPTTAFNILDLRFGFRALQDAEHRVVGFGDVRTTIFVDGLDPAIGP